MADLDFTVVENGYSPQEVDRYIEVIQQEYNNAVAWGEELEKKVEELKEYMERNEIYFTIDEENQSEVIDKVFSELTETVKQVKLEAANKAQSILAKANEKSRSIIRGAMESSVELRTQNGKILKNLKSISDMINVIIEKASD